MASRRLRILLVSSEYPPEALGGMGSHVAELARGLDGRGCEVIVLCPTLGASDKVLTEGNISAHFVAMRTGGTALLELRALTSWIDTWTEHIITYANRYMAEVKPDLIHFHDWLSFPTARTLSQRFGLPTVGTVHLLNNPLLAWWGETVDEAIATQEARMFAATQDIITVSHSMATVIRETHPGFAGRIHVVHNGLDAAPFMHAPAAAVAQIRAKLAVPEGVLVLFAGRLNPQKGLPFLIDAASRVVERHPGTRYIVVGEAATRQGMQDVHALPARHDNLHGNVRFLGRLPRKQLALLYHAVDISVVPSVYEPFGYAAVESMAAGVPTVASNTGGLAEIIEHEQTGLLVPVYREGPRLVVDVAALADAQSRLIDDRALARRLGAQGRSHVLQHFSRDRMVAETIRVYEAVCR
jgi:starch synthase